MSTTEEKIRALESANTFLVELLNPKLTPRVPMEIRVRAQRILRHLPIKQDLKEEFRFKPGVYEQITGRSRDEWESPDAPKTRWGSKRTPKSPNGSAAD